MIYFKTVDFNFDNKAAVEAALRKASIKRTTILDVKSSISDIGTDKIFFGYDAKDALHFTRIRSSVEQLLPKMIISFPKSETDSFYRIRLSVFPFVLYVLVLFGFVFNLVFFISGKAGIENLLGIIVMGSFFIGLFLLELTITSKRIKKAIEGSYAN